LLVSYPQIGVGGAKNGGQNANTNICGGSGMIVITY